MATSYDYDLIVIGLGPAGMAVSIMASEMDLKVCAVEKHLVGGECMNVGCIPSKSLLRIARHRRAYDALEKMALAPAGNPPVLEPFGRIQRYLSDIREKKTMGMFRKVNMVYQQGPARFVDGHTIAVAEKTYTARHIFICAGTRPEVPDFPGLKTIDYLTNENLFGLTSVPDSLIILGGGAIACEMAQAFARLGSKVTMIFRGPRLMWREDSEATDLLEKALAQEGATLLRNQKPTRFEKRAAQTVMTTDAGEVITAEKVLVAAGRSMDYRALQLENAGVRCDSHGAIIVDRYLRTTARHIFAVGDCNGHVQLSHAAMHQGMLALMNCMLPGPGKRDFRKYAVPWTVFTEPQISQVGMRPGELDKKGIRYETVQVNYADYGAAIAEGVDVGFIKAFVSPAGRIHGVYIVGEGSGEMINEWALAIQNRIPMHKILLQQHSFPTMGFLTKRAAETWMMNRMKSSLLRKLAGWFYRL